MLTADLNRGLAAGPSQDALSEIVFGSKPTMRDFLDALERAGDDARVKGLYARLGQDALALATVQEIRDAIPAFRAKGKFAIAFTESFGEFGPGTRSYYLATAFDEIWLQPLGIGRADRAARRDAVLSRHARPARHRRQLRPSRGIQERDEQPDRDRDDRRRSARRSRRC